MNLNRNGRSGIAIGAVSAVLIALSLPGFIQSSSAGVRQHADSTFFRNAAGGGMGEVELGQVAIKRASNEAVKQFGQRMVDDHSKANDELKAIAQRKSITLPSEPDAKDKAMITKLSALNGAEFDRAYIADMVRDHKADVAEFTRESRSGKDPDAKAFAAKTLPTLQEHLKMAQDAQKQLAAQSAAGRAHKKMN